MMFLIYKPLLARLSSRPSCASSRLPLTPFVGRAPGRALQAPTHGLCDAVQRPTGASGDRMTGPINGAQRAALDASRDDLNTAMKARRAERVNYIIERMAKGEWTRRSSDALAAQWGCHRVRCSSCLPRRAGRCGSDVAGP